MATFGLDAHSDLFSHGRCNLSGLQNSKYSLLFSFMHHVFHVTPHMKKGRVTTVVSSTNYHGQPVSQESASCVY
jgi:hypothetical protein